MAADHNVSRSHCLVDRSLPGSTLWKCLLLSINFGENNDNAAAAVAVHLEQ